jgi:hypothetical protein
MKNVAQWVHTIVVLQYLTHHLYLATKKRYLQTYVLSPQYRLYGNLALKQLRVVADMARLPEGLILRKQRIKQMNTIKKISTEIKAMIASKKIPYCKTILVISDNLDFANSFSNDDNKKIVWSPCVKTFCMGVLKKHGYSIGKKYDDNRINVKNVIDDMLELLKKNLEIAKFYRKYCYKVFLDSEIELSIKEKKIIKIVFGI